jgi:hypothetical protein
LWIEEYLKAWELIKQKYIEAPILTPPYWDMEFHIHTYASLLYVESLLEYNVTRMIN